MERKEKTMDNRNPKQGEGRWRVTPGSSETYPATITCNARIIGTIKEEKDALEICLVMNTRFGQLGSDERRKDIEAVRIVRECVRVACMVFLHADSPEQKRYMSVGGLLEGR